MTLSFFPWSALIVLNHASSISADTSASTVSESTRTASGSTLLTSILLVGESSKVGVLERSYGVLGRGDPGIVERGLVYDLGRDSDDTGALYRLCVEPRRLLVPEEPEPERLRRLMRSLLLLDDDEMEDKEDVDRGLLLGVNGARRASFDDGVLDTDMMVVVAEEEGKDRRRRR